ncbi:restriction endonuclease subunit S [Arcobacter sp. KX21116]|uniref:restriction endonuclease subunit S n=1 Tax=Arcobacter iocasae TaxID=2906515 RepID=UPI0035D469CC
MKIVRYDQYKDNELNCFEKIPKDWNNYRIDWISKLIRGNSSFKKDELLDKGDYIGLQYGKTYQVNIIDETFKFYVNGEFYKSNQVVKNGDTILISTSETLEDLGHTCFYKINDLGLIGGEQILIKPNTKYIINKYLFYCSKVFSNKLRRYATGLKVFRVNTNHLKNLFISLPNKETQIKIVNYLDIKIEKTDKEILILEQKIEKYIELKKTLISETVLRGLNKNFVLKESETEWIGYIPEHWEIKRIDNAFQERRVKVSDSQYPPLSVTKNGVVPQLENVAKTMHNDNRMLVRSGDYVINSRSDRRGSSGLALQDGSVSVINIILEPKKDFFGKYLHHLFRSYFFIEEFYRNGKGIVDDLMSTKYSLMRTIDFPIPPYEEQVEIANYLDEKTVKIDSIVKSIGKKIEVLKEFRKTLINDVVTGKVKVA